MVLFSCRPLHVTKLGHAIATPLDRALDQDDLKPNFIHSLGSISGALLELDFNEYVHFVHLSVSEFLTGPRVELNFQVCRNQQNLTNTVGMALYHVYAFRSSSIQSQRSL
jgi:hypothetical protein